MKNYFIVFLILIVILLIGVIVFKQDKQVPDTSGPTLEATVLPSSGYSDEIQVTKPMPNEIVSSPLLIEGRARGQRYFEASFTAELIDANEKSLGVGIVTAQGEWMTTEFVPFESKIIFSKPDTKTGKLVFKNANPSGLSQNHKELIIPVQF